MKKIIRFTSIILVFVTITFCGYSAKAAIFHTDIRVLLSTQSYQSMNIKVVGDYYIKQAPDFSLDSDEISIQRKGNRVIIKAGEQSFSATSISLISKEMNSKSSYVGFYNSTHGFCTYLGDLKFDISEESIRAINTLSIEHYLYGLVPYEMSNGFPIEALKAQAICARGYAVSKCSQNQTIDYDILDTADDQVYHGYASKYTRAIAAVDQTQGQILTNDGEIIQAFYSASNGGQTELVSNVWYDELPYYTQIDDYFDILNPESPEEKFFIPKIFDDNTVKLIDDYIFNLLQMNVNDAAGKEVTIQSIVNIKAMNPIYDIPSRSYSEAQVVMMVKDDQNKTGQITITLSLDDLVVSDENTIGIFNAAKITLRMRGVEKTIYKINSNEYDGWFLTNRRYGHGIGLSQRGAQQRATFGHTYLDILDFYYVNTEVYKVEQFKSVLPLSSEKYFVSKEGIRQVKAKTKVDDFLSNLSTQDGQVNLVSYLGKSKTEDIVVTGDFIRMMVEEKTFLDIPVIVEGDVDGDGKISKDDIDLIHQHILGDELVRAYQSAADVNHDGIVNSDDMLQVIWHINGRATINK